MRRAGGCAGARNRVRTGTPCDGRRILSPLRLPVSPSGRALAPRIIRGRGGGLAPPRATLTHKKKGKLRGSFPSGYGAGNEARTRDLNLGKVALYQLSYSRKDACAGMVLEARPGVEPG